MSDVTEILDHDGEATKRIIEQFKNKPRIKQLLEIYTKQVQEAEAATFPLLLLKSIEDQEGAQLDLIGEVIGEPRQGKNDTDYRLAIYIQIGQNSSEGEPERVIQIFLLLVAATYVHYINNGNGNVELQADQFFADQESINFVFRNMQKVLAAGVRLALIVCHDTDEAFTYAGTNGVSGALGYANDAETTGGKYATGYQFKVPFAYDGNDVDVGGYGGAPEDPLVGGVYST